MDTVASLSEKLKFTSGSGPATSPRAVTASASEAIKLEDLGISPSETLAGRDALPELERLRLKSVARVRGRHLGATLRVFAQCSEVMALY